MEKRFFIGALLALSALTSALSGCLPNLEKQLDPGTGENSPSTLGECFTSFQNNAAAVLEAKCEACHSPGNPVAGSTSFIVPSDASGEAAYNSYIGASALVNFGSTDPDQSGLLIKGNGGSGHTGGAAFAGDDSGVRTWLTLELSGTCH